MGLDQPERLVDVELLRRQQDGRHAARGLHQLMHAGAVRQRRHHQRGVVSVVPGIRSARWLVMTKAIWPWVSTAALERPVVPEVKKNQQGSS